MTRLIFFDASALAKRYASERGSDVINWLFDATADYQKLCALLGAAEIVSVLARKRNRGDLSTIEFAYAFNALFNEHLFFVSADKRLVRAAKDEGLFVINPEQSSVPEISKLLNG